MDGKPSLKGGGWLGHVNHLNFGRNQVTNHISGTAAGRVATSIVSGAVNLGGRSVWSVHMV